ncbi:MAG TPA: sporulation transcriptional regulator SpoIIID [Pseudobacteroides sp.]|uniref:sporulation transcriptional regulator SpoIIID n=1 Tax=Pseudobacteroides sp. TaxID=1968840 RepID=UPI002F93F0F5
MKEYIEERAVDLANFIIENKATVRAAAKKFGISKSTVQTALIKRKGIGHFSSKLIKGEKRL